MNLQILRPEIDPRPPVAAPSFPFSKTMQADFLQLSAILLAASFRNCVLVLEILGVMSLTQNAVTCDFSISPFSVDPSPGTSPAHPIRAFVPGAIPSSLEAGRPPQNHKLIPPKNVQRCSTIFPPKKMSFFMPIENSGFLSNHHVFLETLLRLL